ncbi:Aste57867_19699 [Aphanomyces stellatus]|uniref:Aste57867_19699 protein n=1 Tax=Aphanomyces stellatus TaxID=120398 RepID=A0A485LEN7_9STRA|nr:hypothetical protein As57867_019634 [Aphanomyces stellatus]VFT96399.1 Aste57867_19699 [Aphanomyces stellatus]
MRQTSLRYNTVRRHHPAFLHFALFDLPLMHPFTLVLASLVATSSAIGYCSRCTGGLLSNTEYYDFLGPYIPSDPQAFKRGRDLYDPWTHGKRYHVAMQDDGNLVLYDCVAKGPIWAVKPHVPWVYCMSAPRSSETLVMQGDGNLVIALWDGLPIWNSNSSKRGVGPYCATISLSGKLVILDSACTRIWSHDGSTAPPGVVANSTYEP